MLSITRRVPLKLWPLTCLCMLLMAGTVFGQATGITSTGFNATIGGGGTITYGWTTGNLGNSWAEGEWVPYQLIISNVQTDYPNLAGFPNIVMEYDFMKSQGGQNSRFVDLVRSIQVGTTALTDSQGWPRDDATAYPLNSSSVALLDAAQNDVGNTGNLQNVWPGFALLNPPDAQVNRGPGFTTGSPTDATHFFYLTRQNLIDAGVSLTANTIIIYYQLHESRSFVWANSLQEQYDQPQTDRWGGYLYSLAAYAADVRNGAGYAPGSSGHITVAFASGAKTVPIPIPTQLPGSVSGFKWQDTDGNAVKNGSEGFLSGWSVYVKGTLEGINFVDTTQTDGSGNYSFPNLTSGTTWFINEDAQRTTPATTGWQETYPNGSTSPVGVGSRWSVVPVDATKGAWGWQVPLTYTIPSQANMNFGNKLCQVQLTCPPDILRECTQSIDTQYTGVPTVTSNCPPTVLTYADSTVPGSCPQAYTVYRRWIVADNGGQADTCVQIITVQDTNDPWITGVGADKSGECPGRPSFDTPSASDSCDQNPSLTHADDSIPGSCPQEYSIRRIWTATDDCGNSVKDTQLVSVTDNTAPVISGVGADKSGECPGRPSFDNPTASDACDPNPILTHADDSIPGSCPQEYSIRRIWTATDHCSNSVKDTQLVSVTDNTPPRISGVGADKSGECPGRPSFDNPTADDACDPNPSLTHADDSIPGSCPQEYSIRRIWTATDHCSNSVKDTQVVSVTDNTAPAISGVGADKSGECPNVPAFDQPTATDACDPIPTLTYEDFTSEGHCPYTITRIWTAEDHCGNSVKDTQVVTVTDNTAPVISGVGADKTGECPGRPSFDSPTASDACDPNPSLGHADDSIPGSCPQEYSIRRIWTARDGCGNSVKDTQLVSVTDNTPPVLAGCPTNANYTCLSQVPAPPNVTANDACAGSVTPVYSQTPSNPTSSCNATITRKWVATDLCGNKDSCMQTITVNDTIKPTIACADDKTVACGAEITFDPPTASDNCDTLPVIEVVSDTSYAVSSGTAYERTWKATDACGNVSTFCNQIVTQASCGGRITPTQTTCEMFVAGTAGDLNSVCYGVKRRLVNNTAPGVFFYYTKITAPSASFTVDIVQTKDNTSFPFFEPHQDQIVLYGADCNKLGYGTTVSSGQASVTITGATVGQNFVIGVKYSTSSVVGTFVGNVRPTVHYDFATKIGGSQVDFDADGINLSNCVGSESIVDVPVAVELSENYPNPFNPQTEIGFGLPQASLVTLDIYNVLGQKVATLANGHFEAGRHTVSWDASNQASGMYFYRLTTSEGVLTKKMLLLK